jgi:fatty acid desaturase
MIIISLILFKYIEVKTYYLQIILIILMSLWIGFWFHAYSLFFHEAAHFNLHKNKSINDIMANIIFTPFIGIGIKSYRINHWKHHKFLGTLQDTEVSYLSTLSFFEIVKVVFGIYHFNIIFRINNNLKNLKKNNLLTKNILLMLSLIVHLSLFFFIYNNISNIAGISYFVGIVIIYPLFAKIRQTLEHRIYDEKIYSCSNELKATNRSFRKDWISTYFGSAGFNRHNLHHYDPSISYTNFNELEIYLLETDYSKELINDRTTYFEAIYKLWRW